MKRFVLGLLGLALLGASWSREIEPELLPGKTAIYAFAAADGTGFSSVRRHQCGTINVGFEDGAGGNATLATCSDVVGTVCFNEQVFVADGDAVFVPRYPWLRVERVATGAGSSQVYLACGGNVAVASYTTVQDEGVPLAQETVLDFAGAGVTATAGAGKTLVTIPGGGGSTPTGTGFRHVTVGVEDAASKLVDTADVNNAQITLAKMANIATDSLIGRDTAAAGVPENILLNATLEMDGALNLRRAALTGAVTAAAGSNATAYAGVLPLALLTDDAAAALCLKSGGAGDPAYASCGGAATAGGQNTEVQWNNATALEGADRLTFASATAGAAFGAGTAAAGTWPTFASGTLLTTAEDGSREMDADAAYLTTDAGNRGYLPAVHLCRLEADYTLANVSTEQKLFNCSTNGRITLETGLYRFQSVFRVTAMSATSGNAAFDLLGTGGATIAQPMYSLFGVDANGPDAGAAQGGSHHQTAQTNAAMVTVATGTGLAVSISGQFEISVAGTIQPSITLLTAIATAVVQDGSFFETWRIGSTTAAVIGQWD